MVEVFWEEAKKEERGAALVGSRVRIWWDGDMVWYEGKVVGYDSATAKHQLIYDGVDTDVYIEDLDSGSEQWEIERAIEGGEPGAVEAKKAAGESSQSGVGATTPTGRKSKYLTMVLESISALNEKSGVSLPSIRKWIQDKHPETKEKQKASFNNLTIKAVMKLVSEGAVEKVKHSYRLSPKCVVDEKASAKEEPRRKGGSTPAVLTPQAKTGREPARTGRKPAAGGAAGAKRDASPANRKMLATMEEVARKRNEFLSKRRAFLLPFMQASDNFFTRMDGSLALGQQQQLEKEDRDKATEKPAVEAANPDLRKAEVETEQSRHPTEESQAEREGNGQAGEGGCGLGGERRALSPEERQPPPPLPPPPPPAPVPVPAPQREVKPMDDIDFKAIPADPMTVAETLVKMRVLKREDIAPGAAKVALTGQRCTEWPPLQVDPNTGVPTMEDMGTLGARIDQQGPFRNYHITWPGSRVPVADLKELSQVQVDLTYNHVYYLEKRESLAPPLPPEPVLGPHGWVYPPPPVPRIIGRTTALRLRSGEFVQHRSGFMKRTQSYAKRNNIPVDNLVTFSIINPHTQRRYNVTREFCAAPYYAAIYKRLLKDTLRKNLSLAPIVTRQAPSSARRVAAATAALAAGDPSRASSHEGSSSSDGRSRSAAERPSMAAAAAAGLELSPTGARRGAGGVGNGSRHHPRSASLSPPRRSHQLPRGPGGIDILSCPAKDPPPESGCGGGGGAGRTHVRSVSSADVTAATAGAEGANDAAVAAAAMLGLGAEVFTDRGGRGPAVAKESCGSSGAVRGPPERAAAGGEDGAAVAAAAAHRSDSHADGIRVELDRGRDRHDAAWAATEVTLARRENGGGGGGGVTSERRSANGGGAEAAAAVLFDGREEEQLRRERGGGDDDKEAGPPEEKGGAGAEEAVKEEEGMDVEEPLSERKAEDEDVEMAAEDFDPSDVLKGVPAVNVPESIKANLQGYQRDGLSWMVHMYNNGMPLILGDQTGLGKTLQGIALIAHLQQVQEDTERVSGPFLIVVPFDALGTWMSEIDKFCPSLRTVRFHGSKEERSRIKETEMKDSVESEVVVTTHETFSAEGSFFKKRSVLWQLVVVDEGHRQLKNDKSQLSQKLKQVNTMCRVLLTGTPPKTDGGMNNLRELWAVLHFLVPDVFPEDTAERFEDGVDAATGACCPRRVDQANDLLSWCDLSGSPQQVKLDLPPREEVKILVKLTPAQHLVYRHLLVIQDRKLADAIRVEGQKHDGVGAVVRGGDGGPMSPGRAVAGEGCGGGSGDANGECGEDEMAAVAKREDEHYQKLMTLLGHLRKACNHPHMLVDVERGVGETEAQTVDYTVAASGKLALLDRMLPRLQ
ncbi:unnamed protein product, partial [Ectocarpus sp. 12 AP-2014]